jgi:hypothetical protein
MTTIAIPLSEAHVAQLRQRAQQAGMAPETVIPPCFLGIT